MTRPRTLWLVAGGLVLATLAGWALLIGAVYVLGGVMTVEVHDRYGGVDIYVPVPVALLDLAVISVGSPAVATAGLGTVHVDGLDLDLGEVGRSLRAAVEELDRLPDVTLVEVEEPHARVRVAKQDGELVIEVDEPGTSVSVSLPTRGAARLVRRLLG